LRDLRDTFTDVAAPLRQSGQTDTTFLTPPEAFNHELGRLIETIHDWLADQPQTPFTQAILDFYFTAISYQRIGEYYDDTYRMRLTLEDDAITLKQLCLDPSAFLADSLALGHGPCCSRRPSRPLTLLPDRAGRR
jgi:hypothetical protein